MTDLQNLIKDDVYASQEGLARQLAVQITDDAEVAYDVALTNAQKLVQMLREAYVAVGQPNGESHAGFVRWLEVLDS